MGPVLVLAILGVILAVHLVGEWVWARRKVRARSEVVGPVGRERLP